MMTSWASASYVVSVLGRYVCSIWSTYSVPFVLFKSLFDFTLRADDADVLRERVIRRVSVDQVQHVEEGVDAERHPVKRVDPSRVLRLSRSLSSLQQKNSMA